MIELREVCKDHGRHRAVDRVTFLARRGQITALVGPNGAGKFTVMRMLVGLDRPDSGTATIDGLPYALLPDPARHVGALVEHRGWHPRRTVERHLVSVAIGTGTSPRRVPGLLRYAGLEAVADRPAGTLSLGMAQRVGFVAAMLADPLVYVLDEPMNGLDAGSAEWMCTVLRGLAARGRVVLLSSHLMPQLQSLADRVVVMGRGRVIADSDVGSLCRLAVAPACRIRVRADQLDALRRVLLDAGGSVAVDGPSAVVVTGLDADLVAERVAGHGFVVYELARQEASLEQAYARVVGAQAVGAGVGR